MGPKKQTSKQANKTDGKPNGTQNKATDEKVEEKIQSQPVAEKEPSKRPASAGAAGDSKRQKLDKSDAPPKQTRRSQRGAPKSTPTQAQLVKYLLSKSAEELCQPDDESEAIQKRGDIKTYSSSALNPFEELLAAVVLSRPISHRLGLRTLRTILNDPYDFSSAKAVQDAGEGKRREALDAARTQHKGKTVEELGAVATATLEKFSTKDDKDGTLLGSALQDCDHDIDQILGLLKDSIKGLGKTGLDIFRRRIQWRWECAYPFIDGRSAQSLKSLGLPNEPDALVKAIESEWSGLDTKHIAGNDESEKKRRAFVIILERATGADLESKIDVVVERAASSSS